MPDVLRRAPGAGTGRPRSLARAAASMTGFGLAGLSGVGVNQLLLWLLVDLFAVNYLVAAVMASAGSTTSNFLLVEHVVFQGTPGSGAMRRYVSFLTLTAVTIPIRLPILYVLTSMFHVHYLVSNLVALLVIFVGRYAVSDLLIWRARPRPVGGA
jgi:dolichol-phosphate mannosyltransferase